MGPSGRIGRGLLIYECCGVPGSVEPGCLLYITEVQWTQNRKRYQMQLRVYYEDTDAAGMVYHSNYLNYFERARTEYLRKRGCSVAELAAAGAIFPVVRMEIDFKVPARHDELLRITTRPVRVAGASFVLQQQVLRESDEALLVSAVVTMACVTPGLKACRLPASIHDVLTAGLSGQ